MSDSDRLGTIAFGLMGAVYAGIGFGERTFASQLGYFTAAAVCAVVALAIAIDSRRQRPRRARGG